MVLSTISTRKASVQLVRTMLSIRHPLTCRSPPGRCRDRYKDLPPDLQAQWQKDRDKKAEYRRQRDLKRLSLAADPFSQKKGGKKGRKAMLAASRLDPTITVLPNRVIDMTTLVQQIRRFIADVGGPSTMSLPPADKETRKNVHEMAMAFGLRSQSKGNGDARYTTLIKTSKSGGRVDENKVAKIMRRSTRGGGGGGGGREFVRTEGRRRGRTGVPKHREGDEVGKVCDFGFFVRDCGILMWF
jgi:R3H domain